MRVVFKQAFVEGPPAAMGKVIIIIGVVLSLISGILKIVGGSLIISTEQPQEVLAYCALALGLLGGGLMGSSFCGKDLMGIISKYHHGKIELCYTKTCFGNTFRISGPFS